MSRTHSDIDAELCAISVLLTGAGALVLVWFLFELLRSFRLRRVTGTVVSTHEMARRELDLPDPGRSTSRLIRRPRNSPLIERRRLVRVRVPDHLGGSRVERMYETWTGRKARTGEEITVYVRRCMTGPVYRAPLRLAIEGIIVGGLIIGAALGTCLYFGSLSL